MFKDFIILKARGVVYITNYYILYNIRLTIMNNVILKKQKSNLRKKKSTADISAFVLLN